MPSGGVETPIPASVFARLTAATRFVITGAGPESWFGPQQPLVPQAPPEVKGRQWDYPFGLNINYTPRADSALSFMELRALADALPLLRAVIETRKDQIAALNWTIRPRLQAPGRRAEARAMRCESFCSVPTGGTISSTWLRILVEDMLVIDAACLYPRYDRGGSLFSLDIVDGATIKPLIGEDGRSPAARTRPISRCCTACRRPISRLTSCIYLPRNVRSNRLYGFSPVEQIALTVNIALRREQATLDYYNTGSIPDSFATLPKDWTVDQIRQFQDYFDALMSGNLARRRMVKFMPADFKLTETRQPPLKDSTTNGWRASSATLSPCRPRRFVSQVNRATSETLRCAGGARRARAAEGLGQDGARPGDRDRLRQPDLEFAWVGDDAVDPLQQAQTISILVNAGVKTVAEARVELGLDQATDGVAKFNPHHDARERFTTVEGAVKAETGSTAMPDRGVQVADSGRPATMTEAGAGDPHFPVSGGDP